MTSSPRPVSVRGAVLARGVAGRGRRPRTARRAPAAAGRAGPATGGGVRRDRAARAAARWSAAPTRRSQRPPSGPATDRVLRAVPAPGQPLAMTAGVGYLWVDIYHDGLELRPFDPRTRTFLRPVVSSPVAVIMGQLGRPTAW